MSMEDLIEAARKENWEYVDTRISKVCNDTKVQERALQLLKDSDGNVRDLAASILGKACIDSGKFLKIRPVLGEVMEKDSNPYARYRAAFALAQHGPGTYKSEVIKTLKQASKDKDVSEIARGYLERLK